jgi:fibronectin-binding autotransporter adhesin
LGAEIGDSAGANNNAVLVSGASSLWTNSNHLYVGLFSSSNQLTITDGGRVFCQGANIGNNAGASGNAVLVSGAGSLWTNSTNPLYVGLSGSGNQLTITSSGQVFNTIGYIGHSSSNNTVLVSGDSSAWNNSADLYIGHSASSNQLIVSNNGTVRATNVVVGFSAGVTGNQLTVSGGNLIVTNASATGAFDVRRGTFTLNTGTVVVNRLYLTNNASSVMNFSAGLLRVGGLIASNGVTLAVGDGVQSATLDLLGGTHRFVGGLSISTNGNLIGNGSIIGSLTNFGTIAPGHSAGLFSISGDLDLKGSSTLNFEIGGNTTNDYDRAWVGGILRINGLLNVTFTNGYTGNQGDTFDLFSFGAVSGTFTQTNLPTLSPGLEWNTSKLYTLGDIEIVPEPGAGLLLALGMGMLARRRRKTNHRS